MYHSFVSSLKMNKKTILFAAGVFLVSFIIGYTSFDPNHFIVKAMLQQLEDVASEIGTSNSVLYMIFFIFKNNVVVALIMIILGAIFFGVAPLILLTLNGLVIGIVVNLIADQVGNTLLFLLAGILPHGIIEIPAIIIAGAFGMNAGFTILRTLISLIVKSHKLEYNQANLQQIIKQAPSLILGVIVLLFFAAIIESTLTVYLITKVM